MKFGAKDAKARYKEKEKDYEYILDDEIEFVQALKMPGTKVRVFYCFKIYLFLMLSKFHLRIFIRLLEAIQLFFYRINILEIFDFFIIKFLHHN